MAGVNVGEQEQMKSMTGWNGECQMSWETWSNTFDNVCYWKAKSPQ